MVESIDSIADLQAAVTGGVTDWERYGLVRTERMDDLILFDYKAAAQWENRWNWFERASRGLILNTATGEVAARPFDKFFNWGEGGRMPDGPLAEVTDKLDGSLGVLYRHRGEYRVATRGAFGSPQAQWATDFLHTHFDLAALPDNLTLLFEIIYPDNQVVVNYGPREDLALVGVRDRFTGEDFFRPQIAEIAQRFGFSLPDAFTFGNIAEIAEAARALALSREGWVLRFVDGQRFKIKGDAYLLVHRIKTQATFGQVLDAMQNGILMDLIEGVPDEYLGRVRAWQAEIEATIAGTRDRAEAAFAEAPKEDRKTFALWVRREHMADSPYLFALLDGHDITPLIYRLAFKHGEG